MLRIRSEDTKMQLEQYSHLKSKAAFPKWKASLYNYRKICVIKIMERTLDFALLRCYI